jgi:hypothetical protein
MCTSWNNRTMMAKRHVRRRPSLLPWIYRRAATFSGATPRRHGPEHFAAIRCRAVRIGCALRNSFDSFDRFVVSLRFNIGHVRSGAYICFAAAPTERQHCRQSSTNNSRWKECPFAQMATCVSANFAAVFGKRDAFPNHTSFCSWILLPSSKITDETKNFIKASLHGWPRQRSAKSYVG